MRSLSDQTLGQAIYPTDVHARADVNRWLFWSAYHFTPAVGIISREKVSKSMVGGSGAADPTEVARGEGLLRGAASVLDAHLGERQWIALDALTLADLAIAAPLMHMEAAQLPLGDFANLQAWFDRVRALEAWKRTSHASSEMAPAALRS